MFILSRACHPGEAGFSRASASGQRCVHKEHALAIMDALPEIA